MGLDQIDLDFNSEKKIENSKVIPYSETLPKNGESDKEYTDRILTLAKMAASEEVTIAPPTEDDLNSRLDFERNKDSEEMHDPDIRNKLLDNHPNIQKIIDQIKKDRKDLYN